MRCDVRLPLLALFGGLSLASSPIAAAQGFVATPAAGLSGPAPRLAPARPAARSRHFDAGRAGMHRVGYPGYHGWSGGQQTVIVLSEASEPPPAEEPSIPVAIGIPRPPAADPVLYRIETRKGRPVVRVMRFASDGRVARR